MKAIRTTLKTKCDFTGCKNLAEFQIFDEGSERSMMFCGDCIKEMHKCINAHFAPISIIPPFKKTKKLR